jgi:hypothetical protein
MLRAIGKLARVISSALPKMLRCLLRRRDTLKGLSHEIDFKNVDKNLQNLAYLWDAAGF